ncbi:MAG: aminotransferase class V-fold PLP-dependent enzyme, partial [Sphingomonadales bacterium]|nr:aminotransferase class V-fold PLP-dependent enzyme [Sphingomonadales bacterium]
MPGMSFESQVMAFDLAGICISAGSACASGAAKVSGVLGAMGVSQNVAQSVVRVSLGHTTTIDDIENFISVWKDLYEREAAKRTAA